ncbi:MAG TPA: LLM class flavin-dependent oxidoreductase [Candidatus Dormibacteraeota bacterium]|nr:LLM class flavin-dependent oxidoreductase [Candidatus Dormibacteraeota bacterium]
MTRGRVGLLLPSRETLLWGDSNFAALVQSARAAEEAGFDSVWVGDSLLARPRGEPLLLLAAIAGATSHVALGTAVLLPLLRHPVTLAHSLATLDRVSEGRIVIGVGPGAELPGTHAELRALGIPSERRVGAMLAELERCRRLWRGEEPDIDLLPRPLREGGPPIWVGATGPRMLRATAEKFDGWLPFPITPDAYRTALQALLEAAERAGRNPNTITKGVYLTVAVAETQANAAKQLDDYIRAYYGVPAEVMGRMQALHAGTIETAREWFAAYRAAGAEHIVIRPALPGLGDYDAVARELLAAARPL